MDEIIVKTFISAEKSMNSAFDMFVPYRSNCYEVLGFDILIDNNHKCWLIEANLSPSLSCDTPLDQKVKGNMVADLLSLSGMIPLELRSGVTQSRKQGLNYGAYMEKPKSKKNKRPIKRKEGEEFVTDFNQQVASESKQIAWASGKYTKNEKQALKDMEDEYKRKGHFRRIFPNGNYALYKPFFEEERPLNAFLDFKLSLKKMSKKQPEQYLKRGGSVSRPMK